MAARRELGGGGGGARRRSEEAGWDRAEARGAATAPARRGANESEIGRAHV